MTTVTVLVGAGILLAVPLLLSFLRRRFVVFVSYHHERVDELHVMRSAIERAGLHVLSVPYRTDADHDLLIDQIQSLVQGSDAVVCLPGNRNSFLDAEVFAAAYDRKVLLFLVDFPDGSLPNTAQKSYPVLRRRLSAWSCHAALGDLLAFVEGRPRALLRTFELPIAPHPWVAFVLGLLFFATAAGCMMVIFGSMIWAMLWYVLGESFSTRVHDLADGLGFSLAMSGVVAFVLSAFAIVFYTIGVVASVFRHLRLVRVLRRRVIDGDYTYLLLKRALGGEGGIIDGHQPPPWVRRILATMWRRPPAAHHQRQSVQLNPALIAKQNPDEA